jgi:hypothetical protein
MELNIHLLIRGKLIKANGTELDSTDYKDLTNNLLHSLISQCNITLNVVTLTRAAGLYPFRTCLESLITYGSDAAASHLTNAFWYLDIGNTFACNPTASYRQTRIPDS